MKEESLEKDERIMKVLLEWELSMDDDDDDDDDGDEKNDNNNGGGGSNYA
jgi:hypothetical protein